jgi:hypothetical protein
MLLPTNMTSRPLVSTATLPAADELYSDRLCFYCTQLSMSVENLRGSINRYESYKESKRNSTLGSDDASTRD